MVLSLLSTGFEAAVFSFTALSSASFLQPKGNITSTSSIINRLIFFIYPPKVIDISNSIIY